MSSFESIFGRERDKQRECYKYNKRETCSKTDRERWRRKGWTFRKALKETVTQKLRRKRDIYRDRTRERHIAQKIESFLSLFGKEKEREGERS